MNTLIAFPTHNDPFLPSALEGHKTTGPILSLLRQQKFERVILLTTVLYASCASRTETFLREEFPNLPLEVQSLNFANENTPQVISAFREHLTTLLNKGPEENLTLCLTDGNPFVDSALLFLTTAQAFPINLVQVKLSSTLPSRPPFITYLNKVELKSDETADSTEAFEETAPFLDDLLESLGIYGQHPAFRKAIDTAAILAQHSTTVLIQGETGTGKDLFSKLIHHLSPRRAEKLTVVNCAALPDALSESILFGHKKGAFTGASQNEPGFFRIANGGTLFLDELAELSLKTQAKLLRVIEDGQVTPLGGTQAHTVDVRLIAATNQDLTQAVQQGTFREDLYYRLRAGEIQLPPLRKRRSDIVGIAVNTLNAINRSLHPPRQFSKSVLQLLATQDWPGNVRDLQNTIERAAILSPEPLLDPDAFDIAPLGNNSLNQILPDFDEGFSLENYLSTVRKAVIEKALTRAAGNQSKASRFLGISPQAVNRYIKIKEYC
tara:strand:+ start:57396 stop:58877 length:1482 start_codon:yes stop_codon:yes gene_type:complete